MFWKELISICTGKEFYLTLVGISVYDVVLLAIREEIGVFFIEFTFS